MTYLTYLKVVSRGFTFTVLSFFSLISIAATSQTEQVPVRTAAAVTNATPTKATTGTNDANDATDEYGIPLKLESPKKVLPQTAMTSDASVAAPVEPDSFAFRKPVRRKANRSKAAARRGVAPDALENQAMKELIIPKKDLSIGVLPTPATVRSRVEQVRNPVRPLAYRLGVSLQPLTPNGSIAIGSLAPYDLSQVGTNAMVAVDGQWLPIQMSSLPGVQAGAFASVGYAQFNYQLRSPGGFSIDDAKLQVVKVQAGPTVSYQLPRSPLWSLHGNVGVGRLLEIQSSPTSAAANASQSTDFASLGLAAERSLLSMGLPSLSVYAGYDYRLAFNRSAEGADVPRHSVLLGFLGNFE